MARRVPIVANGLVPRLICSESVIDFGKRVLLRGSGEAPYSQMITLMSRSDDPIDFRFDVVECSTPDDAGVFAMDPHQGTLHPETPFKIKIVFIPRQARGWGNHNMT